MFRYPSRAYIETALFLTCAGWIFGSGWIFLMLAWANLHMGISLPVALVCGPLLFFVPWYFFDLRNGTLFCGK